MTLSITPARWRFIIGTTAHVRNIGPVRLTRITSSHSSSVTRVMELRREMAALLTRTSMGPSSAETRATSVSMAAWGDKIPADRQGAAYTRRPRLGIFLTPPVDDHPRALRCEALGHRTTDAADGAGHHHHFAVEQRGAHSARSSARITSNTILPTSAEAKKNGCPRRPNRSAPGRC